MTKFILFCVTLDLSDNVTEMHVMKNSIVYGSLFTQYIDNIHCSLVVDFALVADVK